MPQTAIFGPLFAVMLLTLVVWIVGLAVPGTYRLWAFADLRRLEIPGELARVSPAAISNPSDNLKNLFELPVLFYALGLILFVGFRAAHSAVHCKFNRVMLRFYCYLAASLALWFMVLRAASQYLPA